MDEFQRTVWLDRLGELRQQAEDTGAYELMYIFGIVYAALEQGQLSRLKDEYSNFAEIRIKELEEYLGELEDQLGNEIVEQARGIVSSHHDDFKLKEDHDEYFPFDENSEQDQCV